MTTVATPATPAAPAPSPFDPTKIDVNSEYDVKVTRPISYGAARILPLHDHIMTGAFLALIVKEAGPDAIHSASLRK